MKASRKDLFSFSTTESEYFNDAQDKFKLVNCPIQGKHCIKQLPSINKSYLEAEQYRRNKEFHPAINTLKRAYFTTLELKEPGCSKCVDLFQSSITQSLEEIKDELHKMSIGWFKTKRYESSYLMSGKVLRELELKD